MTSNFSTNHVDILSFAQHVDLPQAEAFFAKSYTVKKYRDALHVDMPKGQLFIFDYGVLVAWGINAAKKQQVQAELLKLSVNVHAEHWDHYSFKLHDVTEADAILPSVIMSNDKPTLPSTDVLVLLSISHAFAQSSKLELFEAKALKTIADNRYLTQTLANTGNIPLSRKKLAKLRGQLFQAKSDIMLNFSLLDTPEFFWEHPLLEGHYLNLAKYLELTPRIELLNLKLQTIHELFEMLAAEQNHKHSSFLEWIIIILIAVEIVLFFTH